MKTKIALLVTTAMAGSLLATAALAQDSASSTDKDKDKDSGGVAELVVTATRREEKVLDIPYNISAVSGSAIDAGHVQNSAELLREVPGVAVIDRGARNAGAASNVQMRGVNVDGSANGDFWLPTVATVSTYVGETPIFANFVLTDLNRVEVLRGPQGTLYGSGSLGGTIRYIPNLPQFDKFSARLGLTGLHSQGSGSVGGQADLVVNLPLSDTFALRFNGEIQDTPGIVDYVNPYKLDANGIPALPAGGVFSPLPVFGAPVKDADSTHIKFGRIAARWDPTSKIDLVLSYANQNDNIGGRRQVTTGVNGFGEPYGSYQNGAVLLEPSKRQVELTSLEGTIDFGFATLTSSTSQYDHTGSSTTDNTGFYANDQAFHTFYYNYPRPAVPAYRTYGDKGVVQELRLVSAPGKSFDWVVGLYGARNNVFQTQDDYVLGFQRYINAYFGLPADSTAVAQDYQFKYRVTNRVTDLAGYGELTWHATDKLQLTGGLRHFRTDSSTDMLIDFPSYTAVAAPDHPPIFKEPSEKTLFKANVSYKFNDDGLAYATVSQGYRRGGVNAVPSTGRWAEDPRWQTYKPDSATNYEAGLKGRLSSRWTYNVDAFYIDWKNIQLNTFTDIFGEFAVANGSQAHTDGFEGQASFAMTPHNHYSLGYTFTEAKLTADFISPTGVQLADKGEQLPGTPQNAITFAADYSIPLQKSLLTFRVSGYYQSSVRNALSSPSSAVASQFAATESGFALWNTTLTWTFDKWDASLFVKNIFNDPGITGEFTHAYMGTNPGPGPNGALFYGNDARQFISTPRTIGLSLNYNF